MFDKHYFMMLYVMDAVVRIPYGKQYKKLTNSEKSNEEMNHT